jgi:hypothetical protein
LFISTKLISFLIISVYIALENKRLAIDNLDQIFPH